MNDLHLILGVKCEICFVNSECGDGSCIDLVRTSVQVEEDEPLVEGEACFDGNDCESASCILGKCESCIAGTIFILECDFHNGLFCDILVYECSTLEAQGVCCFWGIYFVGDSCVDMVCDSVEEPHLLVNSED